MIGCRCCPGHPPQICSLAIWWRHDWQSLCLGPSYTLVDTFSQTLSGTLGASSAVRSSFVLGLCDTGSAGALQNVAIGAKWSDERVRPRREHQSIRWAKATMIPSGPRTYAMRQILSC